MTEAHTERLESALARRYRIERKLGEGGMASVYLAEDLKHERKVALKILRPELAAVIGAERFLSEIKTTANLQHPHILPLFDSGEACGYLYYVMPYIEGETLREKLDREKQFGVEESVRIARDVADALDYAHRAGVIHRDIKPGNILLHDGRPVVADFGIALAVSAAGGGRMTETGLSLGTPHYMSPEQASADRDLSARSDVYSLGCVLYEMIAGQPPHTGPSAQSILVHILTKDVTPLTELRHTVPPHVAAAVTKSIEKLPADRFDTARQFMDALGDVGFTYEASPRTAATTRVVAQPIGPAVPWTRDRRVASALALAIGMTALAAWGWLRPAPSAPPGVATRALLTAPATFEGGWRYAISPDGRWIVAGGVLEGDEGEALYIRTAGETEWRRLANTDGATDPTFSPDGQFVAFADASGGISRVPVTGGPALPIVEDGTNPQWSADDVITFRDGDAIHWVGSSGGEPELVFALDTVVAVRPHTLPGGRAVVFGTGGASTSRIMLFEIETGEIRELLAAGNQPRYVPTGHIVYGHGDGALMGAPFDLGTLQITGPAVTLLPRMDVYSGGASQFAVSESGAIVYSAGGSGGSSAQRSIVWVGRDGAEEPIPVAPGTYSYVRVSPEGGRLLLEHRGERQIQIWDVSARTLARLNLGGGVPIYPAWMPDGRRVAYSDGGSDDLHWKAANNTGQPAVLAGGVRGDGTQQPEAYFFTADGSAVVLREQNSPGTGDDLVMLSLESGEEVWRLASDFEERNAVLSSNGRWMAYQSNESGGWEVYVRPFPDVDADQRIVSNGGGQYPLWSPDGRELFYLQPGNPVRIISVPVDTEADGPFSFGERRVLMDWPYYTGDEGRNYDISPDGQRFAAIAVEDNSGNDVASAAQVYIVTDWFEELRARMSGR